MTDTPTVSVVMPVYNGERFLAESIDSVLGQTYSDFEFIIVDDGSTDRTGEILAQYAQRDRRVRVHRLQRNLGIAPASNQGVRMARGHYIARMDADDVSLPRRFEKQVRYLTSNPEIAVVGTWVHRFDEHGHRESIQRYPVHPGLVAWSMLFYNSVAHPTVMMRREALDTSNAYSAEYRNVEDYALFIRLSQTARIANLPEILLLYRTWRKSASRQPDHEYQAMRVLRDAVLALGIEISDDQAYALHGLSRDRYPSRIEDIRSVAQLVRTLRGLYLQRVARERLDRIAIDSDAAVRLWLLGALAARRSLPLALSLMSAAMRIRPISLVSFASKVLRRFAMS